MSPTATGIDVSTRTVLVVEDDRDHRETLRDVLVEAGYRVETAADGSEALGQLRSGLAPDVIIVDLVMPVMDGPTMIVELKKETAFTSIPVVAVSKAGDRALASCPVVAGYLRKPFGLRALLENIEFCLLKRDASG